MRMTDQPSIDTMHWLNSSLNRKFAAGTAAGLLISSLVFLVLFIQLYSGQLEQERTGAATQVNHLLQTSLENAMLKRDLEGLKEILNRLGRQPDVLGVMITNPAGEVRFSSDPALLGRHIPPDILATGSPGTVFMRDEAGRELLRAINPVHNKAPCRECHGPIDKSPVNGILYVDYDAAPIRRHARNTTLLLMGSGALIVLINLAGGWWFIHRYVVRPVASLGETSQRLARGDLQARVSLQGRDELAELGNTFNAMAANLQIKVRELQEKEQFLQQLVDAIPDGVRIIDADYRVILANATYRGQLGLEPGAQIPDLCYTVTHDRDSPCPTTLIDCPLREIRQTQSPLRVVHQHQRVDGAKLDVEIYAAPMHIDRQGTPQLLVVESIRDLGQQIKFSHEQKLSELGRLAAGVAHEIHNPLASIRLALHAAQRANSPQSPDPHQVADYLSMVDQEIDSCIQVTERMLKLSMPPPAEPELIELDRVIDETMTLLRWEAETRSVHIELELRDTPLRIMATDSELRMVTLNLAQNALHAMPDGGELRVGCRRGDGRVEVEFTDTGVGIRATELKRIFEPFFSRRADGVRGTGLGLSITKTIVENHRGSIAVESTPGRGSRFLLRFPDADIDTEG